MVLTGGKRVMLSYNGKSKNVVRVVYKILLAEADITPWFAETDMGNDLYEGYALQYFFLIFPALSFFY